MIYTITIYNKKSNRYTIYKRNGPLKTIMINDITYAFKYNNTIGDHYETVKINNKPYEIHYNVKRNTKRN